MKKALLLASLFFLSLDITPAEIIAQWTFNDTNCPASSPLPSLGVGTADPVGGVNPSYVSGASADKGGTNKAWNTKAYPSAASGNKSGGVQFSVSTAGYENIALSWYQENSSTASRYNRLQYTVDGTNYADADVIAIYVNSVYTNRTATFDGIAGVTNNPLFGFRIVSEFASTATGAGDAQYIATKEGSTYAGSGTIHFDLVTVSGTPIPDGNTPPCIVGTIEDQTLRVTQATQPLTFQVMDAESPAVDLTLAAVSSNPAVVPADHCIFGGSAGDRTLTVKAGSQPGDAGITIWVIDPGGKSNSTSFAVTVLAANTLPGISTISWTNTLVGQPCPAVPFSVWDAESPAEDLVVSACSSNPPLLPNDSAHLAMSGSGSNCILQLQPAAGQAGVAPVMVTVSDGTNAAATSFVLLVRPTPSVAFCDPFDYPNGSLLTNSAFLYHNRSGIAGQTQVTNGQLLITASQTEDILAPLADAPYSKGTGAVLYASFKLKCLIIPDATDGYFAHFGSGAYLRARVYAGNEGALSGCYRLSVSNGTDTNRTQLAVNLFAGSSYLAVLRYSLDSATSSLWIDPADETAPHATATDVVTSASVSAFGFRQDADIGATFLIDDLRVGLSFDAVCPGKTVAPIPLAFERNGGAVTLVWTNSTFELQSASTPNGEFGQVSGAASPYTVPATNHACFFRLLGH